MTQRGNALFLILIAVALFAALSYAITQSGRGGGSIDRETRALQATEILNYANQVQNAVMRMNVLGTADTDICVKHSNWDDCSYGCSACANDADNLFSPSGGGIPFQSPNPAYLDSSYNTSGTYGEWVYSGRVTINGVGTTGGGDASADFILYLPYITQELCAEINRGLGLPDTIPADNFDGHLYDGNKKFGSSGIYYESTTNAATIGDDAAALVGEHSACVADTSNTPNPYFFYHVLIPR